MAAFDPKAEIPGRAVSLDLWVHGLAKGNRRKLADVRFGTKRTSRLHRTCLLLTQSGHSAFDLIRVFRSPWQSDGPVRAAYGASYQPPGF